MDFEEFILVVGPNGRVDLLHLSPPCCWCSRANRKRGPKFEKDKACFLATGRLVDVSKCRILTLEQVDGILDPEHILDFRSVINDLTSRHYSVRYKVVHMDELDHVHKRKRLILLAAA